jgi:hypothetical protein
MGVLISQIRVSNPSCLSQQLTQFTKPKVVTSELTVNRNLHYQKCLARSANFINLSQLTRLLRLGM